MTNPDTTPEAPTPPEATTESTPDAPDAMPDSPAGAGSGEPAGADESSTGPEDAAETAAASSTGEGTSVDEDDSADDAAAGPSGSAEGADGGSDVLAADAADAADVAGDGLGADDEDHLPPGQTSVPVGDEVVVDDETMRRALEAILMVTDEPLPVLTLARAVGRPTGDVAAALAELAAEYTEQGRGFDLREVGGGWRYYTRVEAAPYVERFVLDGQQARLTQAALETLAVVAYKQPVSRARVSAIRGVNVDGVMRTLVARGLVEEAGADTESQATLYRTTTYFLERMGMQSLDDLPELAPYLPDMDDIEDELAAQSLPPTPPADPSTDTTEPEPGMPTPAANEPAPAEPPAEADEPAPTDELPQTTAEADADAAEARAQEPENAVANTERAEDAEDAEGPGDAAGDAGASSANGFGAPVTADDGTEDAEAELRSPETASLAGDEFADESAGSAAAAEATDSTAPQAHVQGAADAELAGTAEDADEPGAVAKPGVADEVDGAGGAGESGRGVGEGAGAWPVSGVRDGG